MIINDKGQLKEGLTEAIESRADQKVMILKPDTIWNGKTGYIISEDDNESELRRVTVRIIDFPTENGIKEIINDFIAEEVKTPEEWKESQGTVDYADDELSDDFKSEDIKVEEVPTREKLDEATIKDNYVSYDLTSPETEDYKLIHDLIAKKLDSLYDSGEIWVYDEEEFPDEMERKEKSLSELQSEYEDLMVDMSYIYTKNKITEDGYVEGKYLVILKDGRLFAQSEPKASDSLSEVINLINCELEDPDIDLNYFFEE